MVDPEILHAEHEELDVETFRSELSILQKKMELIEDNRILD